jgi:hypothetical protein
MTNRFLMSVAAAALIAGTGLANAQGMGREAPSAGTATQQSPPSSDHAAPSAATPMNRNDAGESRGSDSGMKSTQSDEKMAPGGGSKNQRAQETAPGQKSKTLSSESNETGKAGKDMKAEGRSGNTNAADSKGGADKNINADSKSSADSKSAADSKSTTTTGQAGAGAKLSSDQRTKISTVIKQQNIQPATNINFSVSVGTRVPRTVGFHPLPTEIISIYPDWRGYEMFLVGDQLVVVNPRTLEIVAVLGV